MSRSPHSVPAALFGLLVILSAGSARAADSPVVGLIPKAEKPIKLDGNLDDWDGAFVTPVHVGHPDFANRGGQVLFLWDDDNLYVGLRCLDRKPAHVGRDDQVWNGDAVEFYLDTRRGDDLGAAQFGPGTLHMFWTPFTGTEVKPRLQVRDLPAFRDFKLKGAEVAGAKTAWGYTAEFKLPWANFPDFRPKSDEVIGIDCELCSSDGGPRADRTFVYSSPADVNTPSAFGRVRLVDKIDPAKLQSYGRALLPLAVTKSANYDWLYGTACISPTIAKDVARLEGKVIDGEGKVRKTTAGNRRTLEGSGFVLWEGAWELFDLPAGTYTVEIAALDKGNAVVAAHSVKVLHGDPAPTKAGQNPAPMAEHTREHARLKEEHPPGRREKLTIGTLFLPEQLKSEEGQVPLFVHFHGGTWLPEVAAADKGVAVLTVQVGSGAGVYAAAFSDPKAFGQLLDEAETKAGVRFGPVGLTAWSAGYGAVRAILRVPEAYDRVRFVLLLDGLHAGYEGGKPGPLESKLVERDLDVFVRLARDAAERKKQFVVVHSEIFPGTYASTTETADYLLAQTGMKREAKLQPGPLGTQQLSEAAKGEFLVQGYAGNSAPDHVDLLHALPRFLKGIDWRGPAAPAAPPRP
jgi:hypothetical protein